MELVLSFYHVGPRYLTQIVYLGQQGPQPWELVLAMHQRQASRNGIASELLFQPHARHYVITLGERQVHVASHAVLSTAAYQSPLPDGQLLRTPGFASLSRSTCSLTLQTEEP